MVVAPMKRNKKRQFFVRRPQRELVFPVVSQDVWNVELKSSVQFPDLHCHVVQPV